jgi:LysM repeat protein
MSLRTITQIRVAAVSDTLSATREQVGRHRELVTALAFTALVLITLLTALLSHTAVPQAHAAPAPPPPAVALAPPAPQPAPHPTPQPAQQPAERTHQVRPGDTLASVALRHGVDYRRIAAENGLTDPNLIRPGQALRIGQPETGVRLIQPGDTLTALAAATGLTVRDLRALNPWITNPNRIPAGAALRVLR